MHLTAEEQKMLDGAYGETVRRSMKVLVALGEIYGADHMIEVKNVHSPGVSYRVAGDATKRPGSRSASRRTSPASSWSSPELMRRWAPSPPTAVPPI